jgi:hypothetical protein
MPFPPEFEEAQNRLTTMTTLTMTMIMTQYYSAVLDAMMTILPLLIFISSAKY